MAHILDKRRRPKAVTGNFLQKFAIPERTDGSVAKSISGDELATQNRIKSVLHIGNCPEDDVRRDVLAESCEEPLRSDTPNIFAVCSLLVRGSMGTTCVVRDLVTYEFLNFCTGKSNSLCLVRVCQCGKFP
jgi:hypothetical protein